MRLERPLQAVYGELAVSFGECLFGMTQERGARVRRHANFSSNLAERASARREVSMHALVIECDSLFGNGLISAMSMAP